MGIQAMVQHALGRFRNFFSANQDALQPRPETAAKDTELKKSAIPHFANRDKTFTGSTVESQTRTPSTGDALAIQPALSQDTLLNESGSQRELDQGGRANSGSSLLSSWENVIASTPFISQQVHLDVNDKHGLHKSLEIGPHQDLSQKASEATRVHVPSVGGQMLSQVPLEIPNLTSQVVLTNTKRVADGSYSTVYSGTYSNHQVAIKVLHLAKTDVVSQRRFRRELFTWWQLRHPNVLSLYGYYDYNDHGRILPSMISEWAENGNAADYIQRDLDWGQRTNLVFDTAKGLQYLHEFREPVIHGDLKPHNVVISTHGVAQVCDFGLYPFIQNAVESGLTTTSAHADTMRYQAYELVVYEDDPVPTVHSDVYSLGCVALEFIYLTPPHASLDMNPRKIIREIDKKVPPAIRPDNAVALLWDLIEPCWNTDPTKRPTAAQFCQDLRERAGILLQALTSAHGDRLTTRKD